MCAESSSDETCTVDSTESSSGEPRRWFVRLPALSLIFLVRCYQTIGSPVVRWMGVGCRFEPTCSHYMVGAVQKYGAIRGAWRGVCRVCRCHPWNDGGFDPP